MAIEIFSVDEKQICYEWFVDNGLHKDTVLADRLLWDGLQRALSEKGFFHEHDEVKQLIRVVEKAGFLGNRTLTFDEHWKIYEVKQELKKETGDCNGIAGVRKRIDSYCSAMSEKLVEYERSTWWSNRSREYREKANWTCEICNRKHCTGSAELQTHHKQYKIDEESVFYSEPDSVLLAVCKNPCHKLADIARYLVAGRLTREEIDAAVQPLFSGIR